MSISFVSAQSAAANTLTMPSHSNGNIIFGFAYNKDSTTIPTVPSGWLTIATQSGDSQGSVIAYKIAEGASEAFGTWTNADFVAATIYSSSDSYLFLGASGASRSGASTTLFLPNLTLHKANKCWCIGFGGTPTSGNAQNAPSGMTTRTSTDSTGEIAIYDTNATVSTFTSKTTSTGVAGYSSFAVELVEANWVTFGGSGGVPLIGHGGLVY
jgi:hypothetical protein